MKLLKGYGTQWHPSFKYNRYETTCGQAHVKLKLGKTIRRSYKKRVWGVIKVSKFCSRRQFPKIQKKDRPQ